MIRSKVSYIWNNLLPGVWVIVRKRTCFLSWMVSFCCGILGRKHTPSRIALPAAIAHVSAVITSMHVKTCHVIDRTFPRKVYANDSTRVSSFKSDACAMIRSKVSYIWNNLLPGVWVIVRKRTCFLSWMVSFCCGILGRNAHTIPNRQTITKQYGPVFDKRVVDQRKRHSTTRHCLKQTNTWFFILFLSLTHTYIVYTLSLCLAFIICFTINSVSVLRPGRASIALTIFLSAAHLSLRFLERL